MPWRDLALMRRRNARREPTALLHTVGTPTLLQTVCVQDARPEVNSEGLKPTGALRDRGRTQR